MNGAIKFDKIRPQFVEYIPDRLEEGVLYISERFRICIHKCCCGCGEEAVTPLSPAEWELTREGDLVSLWPSVGNWDYACRSHYVIRRNRVVKALPMTKRQIARVHRQDHADLSRMLAANNRAKDADQTLGCALPARGVAVSTQTPSDAIQRTNDEGILHALWRTFFGN